MSAPGEEYNYLNIGVEKAISVIRLAKESNTNDAAVIAAQFENLVMAFAVIMGLLRSYNNLETIKETKDLAFRTLGSVAWAFDQPYQRAEIEDLVKVLEARGMIGSIPIKKDEEIT
jgi:hypothetical protein